MSADLALRSGPYLVELHEALSSLDRRVRDVSFEALAERVKSVAAGLEALPSEDAELGGKLGALRDSLASLPEEPARPAWLEFRNRVQPHYEAVVHDLLRERVTVPSLRPKNYARNALHLASSCFGLAVVELSPSAAVPVAVACAFAGTGWALELARSRSPRINEACLRLFGRTAHPHEAHRVNSATWYATALVVIAASDIPAAAAVALLTLGLGDPAGAIVGRRFGRYKLAHGRTLEGTLAVIAVSVLASLAFLAFVHPELARATRIGAALAGATAGALAELASRRVDDNLTIPLAAFAAAAAAL